jgi:hypothetical protein
MHWHYFDLSRYDLVITGKVSSFSDYFDALLRLCGTGEQHITIYMLSSQV